MGECSHGRFPKGLLVDRELDNHITAFLGEILGRTKLIVKTPGVVIFNTQEDGLKVVDGGSGTVTIKPGHCIDSDGQWIEVTSDSADHAVTDDSLVYNVLIEFAYTDDTLGVFRSGFPVGGESGYTQRHRSFTITITQSAATALQTRLATVSNTGGTLTIVDKRGENLAQLHIPQGSISEDMLGAPTPPARPTDLALTTGIVEDMSVTGPSRSRYFTMAAKSFYVEARWGEVGTGGVGGPGTFYVVGANWPADHWSDPEHQYLTDSAGVAWEIAGNDSENLDLVLSGTPADGDYMIGPAAPAYEVQLRVMDSGNKPVDDFAIEQEVKASDSPVPMYVLFANGFDLGTRVGIRVRSCRSWHVGGKSPWTAWVYITCEITKITDPPPNVNVVEATGGVMVSCDSHSSSCTGIEVAYTFDDTIPNWNTSNFARSSGFKVYIPAPPGVKVKVKVRYVDNAGQPATTDISAENYSGRLNLDQIADGKKFKKTTQSGALAAEQAIPVGAEVEAARGANYDTLKARIDAVTADNIDMLYNDSSTATAAGSSAPNLPEYIESNSVYYDKIKTPFRRTLKHTRRYVQVVFMGKFVGGPALAKLSVVDGDGGSETERYSGEITIQNSSWIEYIIVIDLDQNPYTLAADAQAWLSLKGDVTGTAYAKHVTMYAYS